MTRTSRFDFGSGLNPDPANQWDTKCKLFSMAEVCTLPSAVLVPECSDTSDLANDFSRYFVSKTDKIRERLDNTSVTLSSPSLQVLSASSLALQM